MDKEVEKLLAEAEDYQAKKVKHAAAEKLFEAATILAEKKEEAESVKLLMQAAKLYEGERTERIEEFLEKIAGKLTEINQHKLAAETYCKAAQRHTNRADHRGAIPLYTNAAEAYRKANILGSVAQVTQSLAQEYEELGETIIAAQHLEKEADIWFGLKDVLSATRALDSAREKYVAFNRFDESARCAKRIAEALQESGKGRDAQRYYSTAAEDLQRAAEDSATGDKTTQATGFLLQAASIYQKAGEFKDAAKCHMRLSEMYAKIGSTGDSAQSLRKAVIDQLLAMDLKLARSIVDLVKDETVRSTAAFRQSLNLVETFETANEERMNAALKGIDDFSWVRLCLSFGKYIK